MISYPCHKTKHKRSILIGRKTFDNICSHVQPSQSKLQAEKEEQYQEYLKNGSREMTSNWTDYLGSNRNENAEIKKKLDDKKITENAELEEIFKEKQKQRIEKIAKAELLLQKLRPGPKLLESAAMSCECIQGNIIHQNIKNEFQQLIKKQEEEDNKKYLLQVLPWIDEEKKRGTEIKKNIDEYKKELYQTIQENEKRKLICKKHCQQIEKAMLEKLKCVAQEETEKERRIQNEKKEKRRRNHLESIKMSEQRREREKCENKIDCKVNSLTLASQHKIDCIKKHQLIKNRKRQQTLIDANIKRIGHIFNKDYIEKEDEQYKKKLKELELEYAANQQKMFEKEKALRLERIQQHHDEMQRDKEKMDQKTEEYRFDIANRLKNIEINKEFAKLQKGNQIKKKMSMINVLNYQIKEKQRLEKEEKEIDIKCSQIDNSKEDTFFFDYANKFMNDAVAKGRTTYPIEKAILRYKKERSIDIQKPIPSHLRSSISIGIRTPEPNYIR